MDRADLRLLDGDNSTFGELENDRRFLLLGVVTLVLDLDESRDLDRKPGPIKAAFVFSSSNFRARSPGLHVLLLLFTKLVDFGGLVLVGTDEIIFLIPFTRRSAVSEISYKSFRLKLLELRLSVPVA